MTYDTYIPTYLHKKNIAGGHRLSSVELAQARPNYTCYRQLYRFVPVLFTPVQLSTLYFIVLS